MTEKELKKLSRLDLLELLLEQTNEKERLKEELEQLKSEKRSNNQLAKIERISGELSSAVSEIKDLKNSLEESTEKLSSASRSIFEAEPVNRGDKNFDIDKVLYCKLLSTILANDKIFNLFPAELQKDIHTRVRDILAKGE